MLLPVTIVPTAPGSHYATAPASPPGHRRTSTTVDESTIYDAHHYIVGYTRTHHESGRTGIEYFDRGRYKTGDVVVPDAR